MTPLQLQVFQFIEWSLLHKGVSPSYQEIADNIGCSSRSNGHRVIQALIRDGFLRRLDQPQRNLEIVKRPGGTGVFLMNPMEARFYIGAVGLIVKYRDGLTTDIDLEELLRLYEEIEDQAERVEAEKPQRQRQA